MYENKRSESGDVQNEFSKEHIQKIESLKNIKQEKSERDNKAPQSKPSVPEKKAPPIPNNSGVNNRKKEESKPEPKRDVAREGHQRSTSTKKPQPNLPLINGGREERRGNKSNSRQPSYEKEEAAIEEEIEEELAGGKLDKDKKKVKEDMNIMKSTFKNNNVGDDYFAFQAKVTNILEEQAEVFATHMAASKEDAKLLTQESELISKVQGVGYVDFDVDSYVEKLQNVVKKKLKMYNLLSKKVEHFKKCLTEEEEIRHNVKDTHYF